ncbi:MAG: hypothetical protein F6J98_07785 [Moorea sp. SIO4G2]|nr:hypothetical protein [Moorena sp. SIO4G2]
MGEAHATRTANGRSARYANSLWAKRTLREQLLANGRSPRYLRCQRPRADG